MTAEKQKNWIKRHKKLSALIVVILIGAVYLFFGNNKKIEYITQIAKATEIKQTVSVTGTVQTVNNVDLNFGVPGKIKNIDVKVNDTVKKGDLLVSLKSDEIDQQILQASANLSAKQAALSKTIIGARDEEVNISKVKLENYKTQYENIKDEYSKLEIKLNNDLDSLQISLNNLESELADTKITTAQSITDSRDNLLISLDSSRIKSINAVEQVKSIIDNEDLKYIYSAKDFTAKANANNILDTIQIEIDKAKVDYDNAKATLNDDDISLAYNSVIALLDKTYSLLEYNKAALDATPATYDYSQTQKTTDITYVTTNQTSISSAKTEVVGKNQIWENAIINKANSINAINRQITSMKSTINSTKSSNELVLSQKKSAVDSAKSNSLMTQAEYDLLIANATSNDVVIAKAGVNQAKAALDQAMSKLDDYQIKAPFDGVVAKINYEEGETVGVIPVLTMIGEARYEIEVDIPESDITKINKNNKVEITLDAYTDDIKFTGKIVNIDPSATTIQDVVYYKIKIELDPTDKDVKDGMTANIDILSKEVKGAIAIAQRAVFTRDNGTKYVKVLQNNQPIEKDVTVGLRGDEGNIEVLTGLNEGDKVVILEKKKK